MAKESNYTLSRVADSLYWMSRYLERAENVARLLDVHLNTLLDSEPGVESEQRFSRLAEALGIEVGPDLLGDQDMLFRRLTLDLEHPSSILYNITAARENARNVREQISSEMWMQINRLYLDIKQKDEQHFWNDLPHEFYVSVKEGSHLFQGITDATMNHNQGWHFIQIGRHLERLTALVNFLNVYLRQEGALASAHAAQTNQYFELVALLKSVSAFEAYCKVYNPNVQAEWIAEFLLFNPEFPRSARFCVEMLLYSINSLADMTMRQKSQRVNRIVGRLQSALNYDEIDDVLSSNFHHYLQNIREQAHQIHDTLYDVYVSYPIESALT